MNKFESLLKRENAAIVLHQPLKPVEGDNSIIFPPTYADIGYNIDDLGNGKNVCTIDSVGSQANRMEPLFKEEPYSKLIPQFIVQVPNKDESQEINVLDAGHRIADALVRFSDKSEEITKAFNEVEKGNVMPLVKMSPTSLVFGCWDSRDTGIKLPRIVRSAIYAKNVSELKRSATYFIPVDYEAAGALTDKDALEVENASASKPAKASVAGLANALANRSHGGILLGSESKLYREAVLSLSALRRLKTKDPESTKKVLTYILSLSLLAITAPQDTMLRMGCELTGDPDSHARFEIVKIDGTRESFDISQDEILSFAQEAYQKIDIPDSIKANYNEKKAKEALTAKNK